MLLINVICLLVILLSLTVRVESQTCSYISNYNRCSTNSACGCLQLSFSDHIGICGIIGLTCSRLSPCQSPNDSCESENSICVHHPQCDYRPLCYPMSMIDQRLCPPLITTSTSPTIATTITTTITTTTTLTSTTIRTSIISNYSSALTINSEMYSRDVHNLTSDNNITSDYYFESIQLIVNTSGTYTFTSISNLDAYGYLYDGEFYPFDPSSNLIQKDDDTDGNGQFQLTTFLEAGLSYTLVFTTFRQRETGPFKIVASGPDQVEFIPINFNETMTTTSTSTRPSLIISNYSNVLTSDNEKYPGTNKYYQAIQIMVNTTGNYDLSSVSNLDTYACLYRDNFNPLNLSRNQIICNDDGASNGQFKLSSYLEGGVPYTLVFTTYRPDYTGPYTVVASGPDSVDFITIDSIQITTPTSIFTTQGIDMISTYSSALTLNSGNYSRDGNFSSNFYYESIELNVNTTGTYTFTSKSNIDTYGYIYQGSFDPFSPSLNMCEQDDQSGGNNQFKITAFLRSELRYILVVTTWINDVTGPFQIIVSGPDLIELIQLNQ